MNYGLWDLRNLLHEEAQMTVSDANRQISKVLTRVGRKRAEQKN